jgi:hypothetical protein
MSDPQREPDSEPYSRPPLRSTTPTTDKMQNAYVTVVWWATGAATLAGVLIFYAFVRVTTPVPLPADAPPAAAAAATMPMPMSAPIPAPAPWPAAETPKPAIAMVETDPRAKLKSCKPYAGFVADQQNPAVSEEALADEAACLCSLAGGFTVRTAGNGLQVYKRVSACPTGSRPIPLEPDAKVWMGSWIDEPGHGACVCSQSVRAIKVVIVR